MTVLLFGRRLNRQRFVGPNAVFSLSGSPMRTTAERHQHFDRLKEAGQPVTLPGPGADRAFLFAEVRIAHGSFSLRRKWLILDIRGPLKKGDQLSRIVGDSNRAGRNLAAAGDLGGLRVQGPGTCRF